MADAMKPGKISLVRALAIAQELDPRARYIAKDASGETYRYHAEPKYCGAVRAWNGEGGACLSDNVDWGDRAASECIYPKKSLAVGDRVLLRSYHAWPAPAEIACIYDEQAVVVGKSDEWTNSCWMRDRHGNQCCIIELKELRRVDD